MCGITAISRVAERSSINDPRQFMRLAALAIESRGKDATGFAWCNDDQRSWYWKKQGPAAEVVDVAPLDINMQVAIGHTRWATQGSAKDNENNHPVVDDNVMLVHNGVINNDYELYDWLDKDYIPKAQVDSQVVATMLACPEAFYAKHPTDLLGMIEGTAALAWIHTDQPGVLHLARLSGRPLTIGWTRRGDLVMSSTPQSLKSLSHWANIKIRKVRQIDEGTYLRVVAGVIIEESTFTVIKPKPKYNKIPSYTNYVPGSYTPSPKGALTPIPASKWDRDDWGEDGIDRRAWMEGWTQDEIDQFYDDDDEDEMCLSLIDVHYNPVDDLIDAEVPEPLGTAEMTEAEIDWDNLAARRGWRLLKGH